MYTEYFRLSEPPFALTPDPRFLFVSMQHREGMAHLFYGVQQAGGFVQLTGEVGCGKTTLCRSLVQQLPPETDVALILNPRLTAFELLSTVCDELRIPYPADACSLKVLFDVLNRHLLKSHAQHRRTVLIIDEAQNLHSDVLEQIRLLTNLETTREKLLQIILIGQPELLSILRRKKLRQLAQRITARYHLLPLSRRETYAYIRHRLSVAGRREPLFTFWALRHVYYFSRGVPRVINIICDRALLGAYSLDRKHVSAATVRRATRETRGMVPWYRQLGLGWGIGVVVIVAMLAGVAAFLTAPDPTASRPLTEAASMTGKGAPVRAAEAGSVPSQNTAEGLKSKDVGIQPKANMVPVEVRMGPKLADILADPALRGRSDASFSALFAQYGVNIPADVSEPGCSAGREQGFECLPQTGGWPKVRRLDLPAVLELVLPAGLRHRVTLVALNDESANLMIAGRQYTFTLLDIDRVWDGSFIILWKPPFPWRPLSLGIRGNDVIWLRQTLDALDGKSGSSDVSDTYDEDLRRRVVAYQQDRSLIPDGFVGSETLVRLTVDLERENAPSISRRTP
jgi:general secretion pathway protein A